MQVSLYIPCYNVESFLTGCIEGVLAQRHPPDEILLIDDGSVDGTLKVASRYPVTVICHERNKGLAAARNTAFRAARNEIVASLDADCIPEPEWLERLLAHFTEDNIAGVGGRLVEKVQHSVADRWRARHLAQHWGNQLVRNPQFMFGNNNILRKSVVAQAGYYDERMRTNGEDADMSARIRALGYDTIYEAAAIVHHMRRDSVRSILDTFWRYTRDYRKPVSANQIWRNFRYSHFGGVRRVFLRDLREPAIDLLGMDAMLGFYLLYRDIRMLMVASPTVLPKNQSSEV